MAKAIQKPRRSPPLLVAFDMSARASLQRQLIEQIRDAILSSRLRPGQRLPSSRTLAADHGIARNTALAAFEQLMAEGYIETRRGAGSFVVDDLPDFSPRQAVRIADRKNAKAVPRAVSAGTHKAGRFESLPESAVAIHLQMQVPFSTHSAPETFPFRIFSGLLAKTWRRPAPALLQRGDTFGYRPLREAIAEHLRLFRAVECDADQILLVHGMRSAVRLVSHLLLTPQDQVWVENPGYPGFCEALRESGLRPVPVAVDRHGIVLADGLKKAPNARMAVVTPSHQYPLGPMLSLQRRLALLTWAEANGAWILEDDYDSEYRYQGRPLTALQGIDQGTRAIYFGTFSKAMFVSMRLGYLVIPKGQITRFTRARQIFDDPPSILAQPALAEFIKDGYLAAHIRRTRKLYAERHAYFEKSAARHLAGLLDFLPDPAGTHRTALLAPKLKRRMNDLEAVRRARDAGIAVSALSQHYHAGPAKEGLLIGFAAFDEVQIEDGLRRLSRALTR